MAAKNIPIDIIKQAVTIIEQFNRQELKGCANYTARFNGAFLYLDRADYGSQATAICRLKFMGSIDDWEFAIFKHSINQYDPSEYFFPGTNYLDGSLEGAMRCGMEAYPA
jgi:hypothetical protein